MAAIMHIMYMCWIHNHILLCGPQRRIVPNELWDPSPFEDYRFVVSEVHGEGILNYWMQCKVGEGDVDKGLSDGCGTITVVRAASEIVTGYQVWE